MDVQGIKRFLIPFFIVRMSGSDWTGTLKGQCHDMQHPNFCPRNQLIWPKKESYILDAETLYFICTVTKIKCRKSVNRTGCTPCFLAAVCNTPKVTLGHRRRIYTFVIFVRQSVHSTFWISTFCLSPLASNYFYSFTWFHNLRNKFHHGLNFTTDERDTS